MTFTIELSPEQVATLECLHIDGFPAASLAMKVRSLLDTAISHEWNRQEMTDNPAHDERVPF